MKRKRQRDDIEEWKAKLQEVESAKNRIEAEFSQHKEQVRQERMRVCKKMEDMVGEENSLRQEIFRLRGCPNRKLTGSLPITSELLERHQTFQTQGLGNRLFDLPDTLTKKDLAEFCREITWNCRKVVGERLKEIENKFCQVLKVPDINENRDVECFFRDYLRHHFEEMFDPDEVGTQVTIEILERFQFSRELFSDVGPTIRQYLETLWFTFLDPELKIDESTKVDDLFDESKHSLFLSERKCGGKEERIIQVIIPSILSGSEVVRKCVVLVAAQLEQQQQQQSIVLLEQQQ